MKKIWILLIAMMVLFVVGCSSDSGSNSSIGDDGDIGNDSGDVSNPAVLAEEIGREFLLACMNERLAEANSLLTESTREMVAAVNAGDPCGYLSDETIYTTEAFVVVDEQVVGDNATVTYEWPRIDIPRMIPRQRVTLLKDSGNWRVSSMESAGESIRPTTTP